MTLTSAPPPTDPIAVWDVEDLAEADLDADLAQRMEDAGWVLSPGSAGAPASGADLVAVIGRRTAAAVAAHDLGPRAALLAG